MVPVKVVTVCRSVCRELWEVPFKDIVLMSDEERKLFQGVYEAVNLLTEHYREMKEKETGK